MTIRKSKGPEATPATTKKRPNIPWKAINHLSSSDTSLISPDSAQVESPTPKTPKAKKSQNAINLNLHFRTIVSLIVLIFLLLMDSKSLLVGANILPQFLLSDGQSEIVLRLKEGPATPVGSLIYTLKGIDRDGDPLTFGLKGQIANELLRIENRGRDTAYLYLKKELDREVEDEYMIILTLNDGKLSEPVQQSMLLLVEDANDNSPVFKPFQSTVKVQENGKVPLVLATLEATDRDEGPYGQVIYKLQPEEGDAGLFSISTVNGQAVVKLIKPLDYEKKFLHQIRVVASDRSEDKTNQAVASIVVQVSDIEDVGPAFVSVPPVTKISEDAPLNTYVLQVRAIDGDRGINNPIKYSLLNENELFGIDSDSGIIFTKSFLDRESARGGSYVLNIVATEQSKVSPRPSVQTSVVINLLDIDDQRPTFKSRSYKAEITENSQEGVPVTILGNSIPEVFDHDLGLNGTFRLRTEGDGGVFEVTPTEGINQVSFLIRVKNPSRLDFEMLKEINFSLIADEASGSRSTKVPFSVQILDANDNFPEFEKEIYQVFLNENSPPGTTVLKVKAFDKDSGIFGTEGIRYTSLTGSIANELNLDPVSGIITILKTNRTNKSSLDRELSPIYYLTVEAQDNAGRGNRNTAQIVIHLQDENDHEPVFLQSRYEARIFENEKEFVSPLRFQARDNDLKDTINSEIHYSIEAGNDEAWFEVDEISGKVRVVKSIDFEKLPVSPKDPNSNVKRLNFTIKAFDKGIPSLFSFSFLTVFVFDVNDYNPRFTKNLIQRTIREDLVSGSQIAKIEATDLDGSSPFNRVFYRIERGSQDKFVIESESGAVRLAPGAMLDYNIKPFHLLEIIALDGGGKQSESSCIVNVTLKDINNKKPRFEFNEVEGEFGGSNREVGGNVVYHASVPENSPKGHFITQIKASDPDSSAVLRYGIDFNKSEAWNEEGRLLKGIDLSKLLELDPVDGILRVGSGSEGLDREMMETIRLELTVQDIGSETGVQTAQSHLLVTVEDENDNDPEFKVDPYIGSIPENSEPGIVVMTVTATDVDKDRSVRYSLRPGKEDGDKDLAKFPLTIDPESGVISLAHKIDREARDWINFTVIAEDSGSSRPNKLTGGDGNERHRSSTAAVNLMIIDKNDNVPIFVDNISNITVKEDAPVGSVVAKVVAKDADTGNYGKITYLLDRKSSMGKFVVDSESGLIKVAEPLDREEQPIYTLVLQAWDNFQFGYASGESRNAFKQITVQISDINDMIPEFLSEETASGKGQSACNSVTEFHEDVIMTIRAKDGDDGNTPNGRVSFKIKSGNELGLFKLEQGRNIAKVVPARSLKGFYGNYTVTVEAQDGGRPPNAASKDFNICISDYNDNKPRFINPAQNFTIKVPENATIGSPIIQVRAVDSDIGQNGVVRYRFRQEFSRHWETFSINPTTGVLTLAKELDREKQKVYNLRIEAYDLGLPTPLSSELDLTIVVKNVDDFKPVFVQNQFMTQLTENTAPGRERIQLPGTVDRDDDEDEEEKKTSQVCYFLINSTHSNLFSVDPLMHILTAKVRLDREKTENHTLTIFATDNCHQDMTRLRIIPGDKSFLSVFVHVSDVNDNAPRFTRRVFTGGVSTSTDYGTEILRLTATDADTPPNAQLKYFIIHPITMSLSEGLSHLINNDNPLFNIDPQTGAISLAFDPQPDMKGHFILNVGVNDTTSLNDKAKALIYLLRDDQKTKIVVRMSPLEVRQEADNFRRTLSNVTGAIVNIDENFKYHENRDGSVDKTKTDFYIHLVHPQQNVVLEAEEVLRLIDLNIEELDDLFKEFNVLDTQASSYTLPVHKGHEETKNLFLVYATGTALFLALVLLVVISLCFAQRSKYQRQLKAATANAYGSNSTIVPRTGNLPNTNVHSVEGSNPIWMQAYHNNWYKEDSISANSESRDSLDENAIGTESTSPPSSHMRSFLGSGSEQEVLSRRNDLNRTYHRNLIYGHRIDSNSNGSNNCLILKKHLETTEL